MYYVDKEGELGDVYNTYDCAVQQATEWAINNLGKHVAIHFKEEVWGAEDKYNERYTVEEDLGTWVYEDGNMERVS